MGPAGFAVHVGLVDGSPFEALFTGLADGQNTDFTVLVPEFFHDLIGSGLDQIAGGQDFNAVIGDDDHAVLVTFGLVFQDQGGDAQLGQFL